MTARLLAWVLPLLPLLPLAAFAADTQTLPKGTFALDTAYLDTRIDSQWNGARQRVSLLPAIDRYEPGGGFQGGSRRGRRPTSSWSSRSCPTA